MSLSLRAATSRHGAEPDADPGRRIWRIWLSENLLFREVDHPDECDGGFSYRRCPDRRSWGCTMSSFTQ
jgi:hypothetical protein